MTPLKARVQRAARTLPVRLPQYLALRQGLLEHLHARDSRLNGVLQAHDFHLITGLDQACAQGAHSSKPCTGKAGRLSPEQGSTLSPGEPVVLLFGEGGNVRQGPHISLGCWRTYQVRGRIACLGTLWQV